LGWQICGGRFDFWNLALYTVILQEMFPVFCTERVGIYITHSRARRDGLSRAKQKCKMS
jgi:hypothetical protein